MTHQMHCFLQCRHRLLPANTKFHGKCRQILECVHLLSVSITDTTRHRATSMYSLTFCIHVMLPERHQWKPAVQAAIVMFRTPPVDGQSPASQPHQLPIYGAQFWKRPASLASHQPAARAHPSERSHYVVISRDGHKLVTRVRVMLP